MKNRMQTNKGRGQRKRDGSCGQGQGRGLGQCKRDGSCRESLGESSGNHFGGGRGNRGQL